MVSDNDFEIRQELLQFFYSTGVHELTSSVELGLEQQEESSLCALWQDFSSSKNLFSTPKPNKIHISPSTQATKYLTPSPMKTPYSEESELETPRSVRGLKHLTSLVKQLVCKHQPASFKHVALKLIDELIVTEGPDRVKEEKNVRRRVYDAINVLIAADVLERNGRNVSWKENWDHVETDLRKEEVEKRIKRVEEKKKNLQAAINKYLAIRVLIHRNKKNTSLRPAIRFPFIVLSTPDVAKNTMSIKVNANTTFLQIKLAKPISLFGDMDILLSLQMHKMKMNNLMMFLPSKELLPYCSFPDF
jgi:transcription factor Dp-1